MLWPGSLLFAPHTRFLLGAGDEETDGGESGTVVTGYCGDWLAWGPRTGKIFGSIRAKLQVDNYE